MKYLTLYFMTVVFVGCFQNQEKKLSEVQNAKAIEIDSLEINDSTCEHYLVDIDTAYFYAKPDSSTKIDKFLTKNDLTFICREKGEFGYAVLITDSVGLVLIPQGWLQLRNLTKIIFTPPKVVKEE